MHKEPITQPFFALPTYLALLAFGKLLRLQPFAEVLSKVLHDEPRLSNDPRLLGFWGLYSNHWRLSKRMDLLELRRCYHLLCTLEHFKLVVDLELFQEPKNTLRARLLQPAWS